jgi:urea transport system permease protein
LSLNWVDWWLVLLGLTFVAVTLFAPKGIGGLFDRFQHFGRADSKGKAREPVETASLEKEARP